MYIYLYGEKEKYYAKGERVTPFEAVILRGLEGNGGVTVLGWGSKIFVSFNLTSGNR